MGQEIGRIHFREEDFERFRGRLAEETTLLETWLRAGRFDHRSYVGGFELEAWLVDHNFFPLPCNQEYLTRLNNPLVVPELSKFNVELNGTPQPLAGRALYRLEQELTSTWRHCLQVAHELECQLAMIGILPTVRQFSVLLHGNEDTGLRAIQGLLANYRRHALPRALSLFVGNVQAAARGQRHLEGQPDYNRVWPGAESSDLPEHTMMQDVVDQMRSRHVFASIDIHNNTGINPHYGCVNRLDAPFLHLATLFSRIVVYFKRPLGVQSAAFAQLCPAVTVECGKPGDSGSETHAATFLEAALRLDHLPRQPVREHDLALYHTVATVKVPTPVRFTFAGGDADVWFEPDIDHMNFRDLPAGTRLGRVAAACRQPLLVLDEDGRDVTERYFEIRRGELRTRRPVMPSMLTTDEQVIRQDCLCYLMERLVYER